MTQQTELSPMRQAMAELTAANELAGPDPVRLGVLSPMTPPGDAMAGVIVARGARLGADYLRENGGVLGGRGMSFVGANDMATADREGFHRSAIGAMANLALVDDVLAVFGQWHLRTAKWVVELCERLGVPMFVENGLSSATHGRRTIFRTYFSIEDRVPLMIDALAHIGARRIGLLTSDTVFAGDTADALVEYGTRVHGMEFLRLGFEQGVATDWRSQLREIAAWGPDAFINGGVNVIAGGGPVGNNYRILEQAIEVGLLPGPALMVTFGFPTRSADYWQMAGPAGAGVLWPASRYRPSWPGLTEIGRWFTERYEQRYGSAPSDTALSAFTDVTVIGQAVNLAGTATREALIEALEAGEFDTWRGPIRFRRGDTHWHHSPPELVILQYQKPGQTLDEAAVVFPETLADSPYAGPGTLG